MAELMRPVWHEYCGANAAGRNPFVLGQSIDAPPVEVPNALLDGISDVPVVLAIAVDLQRVAMMDGALGTRPPVVGNARVSEAKLRSFDLLNPRARMRTNEQVGTGLSTHRGLRDVLEARVLAAGEAPVGSRARRPASAARMVVAAVKDSVDALSRTKKRRRVVRGAE